MASTPSSRSICRARTSGWVPAFARLFGVTMSFAQFFGGTSLLIMVGVILDTLQQIESHLLMRHYDGFFESGMRIKGRSGAMAY